MATNPGPTTARRRSATRRLALTVAVSAALVATAGPGFAATPPTPPAATPPATATQTPPGYKAVKITAPEGPGGTHWGSRMTTAGDLDKDGVNDVYVANAPAPLFDTEGFWKQNDGNFRVYAISGASLIKDGPTKILYKLDSPEPQNNGEFGFWISVIEKAGGKKKPLLAVGAPQQNINGKQHAGKAWVFNGSNGKLLYALKNPVPGIQGQFGSRMGRAGDPNKDGVPDVIVGSPGNNFPKGCKQAEDQATSKCHAGQGQAFIFNGKNGKLLRTLDIPAKDREAFSCVSRCGQLGLAVQGVGDINKDGVTDQQVDAGQYSNCPEKSLKCVQRQGRIYIFSGKNGKLLKTIDAPEPQAGTNFGFQDAEPMAPGDLNGDKIPEIYGNGFLQNGPVADGQGAGWVLNGKTGKKLFRLDDPTPASGGQFGWSMAKTDFNKDGKTDIFIGSAPHAHGPFIADPNGSLAIFNGKNGQVLASFEFPAEYREPAAGANIPEAEAKKIGIEPSFGWSLSSPGDLNKDGRPDYLAGAPGANVAGNTDQGIVIAYISTSAK